MVRRCWLVLLILGAACGGNKEIEPDLKHPSPLAVGLGEPQKELDALMMRVQKGALPKIVFDVDSDKLRLECTPTLDTVASLLLRFSDVRALVVAHADASGGEEHNLELSRRRAKAVMLYLVSRGVPPTSLRFRGLGSSQPAGDNATDEGREKNRRVEFRLSTRDWEAGW